MNQEIDIMIGGKPVTQIPHNGKIFIVAREGSEYSIRLRNNSTNRVTAVTAVDGLNVVNGEPATPKGASYILSGYSSYTIKGFRTSNEEVHSFVFSRKSKSYAAKSENGDTRNCGVIGVVFWSEKEKPRTIIRERIVEKPIDIPYDRPYPVYPFRRPYHPYICSSGGTMNRSSSAGNMNCMSLSATNVNHPNNQNVTLASSGSFDLGTEFSKETLKDKVETVGFEWGYQLGKLEIYYVSKENLKAMGVPVEKESKVTFPSAFKNQGYCKIPKETI